MDWETVEPILAGGGAILAWMVIIGVAVMALVSTTMDED